MSAAKHTLKNAEWHGSGHGNVDANFTIITCMVGATMLIVFSTLYMLYRVYRINKYFTPYWLKEHEDRSIMYIDHKG